MKRLYTLPWTGLPVLAVLILLTACSKQNEPAHPESHAGGNHPRPEASAGTKTGGQVCAAHGAPKEWCFICDASLRDKGRLWCNEHGRYEDRCWICHPEAEDKKRLYCKEHSLYEDECFLCHPELKTKDNSSAQAQPDSSGLMCREHGMAESECGICHPELAGRLKPGESVKIRLPAPDSAAMSGVKMAQPTLGSMADTVECFAELAFNQNKLARLTAPVSGLIQEVATDLGSQVKEGQAVAKIWSATIAEAVAKAVLSHQTLDRERKLRADRVTSERDLQLAEAEHRGACQQLRTLGFTEEQIDELSNKPLEQVLLEIRAPFGGEIVERTAVQGALAEVGQSLFTLADRSMMWAMLNIPEAALSRVKTGQTVELHVASMPGQAFRGKLTWIAAEVDERSRMAKARAEIPNPQGLLRSRMFAQARILTRTAEQVVLLPSSAVQRVDGKPFVFVKQEDDLFEARAVRLGARLDGKVEVAEGLNPQEFVVVDHSFSLKSALLISRLGAGCADD